MKKTITIIKEWKNVAGDQASVIHLDTEDPSVDAPWATFDRALFLSNITDNMRITGFGRATSQPHNPIRVDDGTTNYGISVSGDIEGMDLSKLTEDEQNELQEMLTRREELSSWQIPDKEESIKRAEIYVTTWQALLDQLDKRLCK